MPSKLLFRVGLLCLLMFSGIIWQELQPPASIETERLSVAESLGGETAAGFARALEPRLFQFPRDHGPHPEFKTEWWYYTGNLKSKSGRRFGYQLTFFRIALRPQAQPRSSKWATNQVYMAHFALSDPDARQFHYFERFSRGAQGLAGAEAEPFKVWLENWSATSRSAQSLPMQLSAAADKVSIDLQLDSAKPIVLQGDAGLSQKSTEPGNASYYYSLTRMPTVGHISIKGESVAVTGASWLDREWSTSALGKDQVGWDWFSLQLSDGRELMYYQLRLKNGNADPLSSGVLVAANGSSQGIRTDDLEIEVLDHWRSPQSGSRYPARWRLQLAAQQLDLEIVPLLADQELQTSVRYWEGAVAVRGHSASGPIQGYGYVELTGYKP